jgi:serine/threonine protein kinase
MGPEVGQTICGHIRIEAEASEALGASAFGRVLEAQSIEVEEPLWLTVIGREFIPRPVDLSRFMAGANALLGMDHRSLLRTRVVDREADFAIVGYAAPPSSRPVRDIIEHDEGRQVLTKLAIEIARGLTYLHRNDRLHGSLSPGSVILVDGKVRLWQYGLTELLEPERFAERASAMGGDVVAPEVRKGWGFSPASDVYAWGVLVAALASGCTGAEAILAFEDGAAEFTDDQRVLKVLVERALSQNPSSRPDNGMELLEALSQIGGDDAQRAQKYFLEVYKATDSQGIELDPKPKGLEPGAPRPLPSSADEATPKDGVATQSILEEERERQKERERKNAEREANAKKWGKAPPPIPIDPGEPTPPPPPTKAPIGVYRSAEREPARPQAGVDTMRKGANDRSARAKKPAAKPTPRAVGGKTKSQGKAKTKARSKPQDASKLDPKEFEPEPEDSVSSLKLDLDHGSVSVRSVGARLKEDQVGATKGKAAKPVPRATRAGEERTIADVTRKAGPHGPRGSLMAASVALLATGLALWATVSAAGAAGGMSKMLGGVPDPPDVEDTEGEVEPEPDADSKAPPDGKQAPPPLPMECPEEMAEHGPLPDRASKFCIDMGEQPGLRQAPKTMIDFEGAQAACAALGRRLCTKAEWTLACRGPAGTAYPYGSQHEQDRCNEATAAGAVVDLTRSGARDGCKTKAGVYDMVGNVSEWVAEGVAMGGDAMSRQPSCATVDKIPLDRASAALGFRCCVSLAAQGE